MMRRFFCLAVFFVTICLPGNAQQTLWGVVPRGGQNGLGAVFKIQDQFADLTVVKNFETPLSAATPENTVLCLASNNRFYGLAKNGGTFDRGVLFEFDPSTNTSATKHEFGGEDGAFPFGSLAAATNGKLYGCTSTGGLNDGGILFEYSPGANAIHKLIDFSNSLGYLPHGGVIQGNNGRLYGMTYRGGVNDAGVIFEFDPQSQLYEVIYSFSRVSGGYPKGDLVQATNGKFYAVTYGGGLADRGVLFEFDPATRSYVKKFDFDGTAGEPECTLIQGSANKLFGTTPRGGSFDVGVLFEFDIPSGVLTKRHDFRFATGAYPSASLILASPGKILGVTASAANFYAGAIFEYDIANSSYQVLQLFNRDQQGTWKSGGLTRHPDGKYYGLRSLGGLANAGVIFEFNPAVNQIQKRADLNLGGDGGNPIGGLAQFTNGRIYGMTSGGGVNGMGVIFSVTPEGEGFRKEIDFDGQNGEKPASGFLHASNGKLYGTVSKRGADFGALVEFDPDKMELRIIQGFDGLWTGAIPRGHLVESENGKVYGTTFSGGVYSRGIIYEFDLTTRTFTKIHDFRNETGSGPNGLLAARLGKLYGVTVDGGNNNLGAIYEFDPSTSQYDKLYDFELDVCYNPRGGVVIHPNGKLYGTASSTPIGGGCVYEFDLVTKELIVKVLFSGLNGLTPFSDLILGSNGKVIGSTAGGGSSDAGTLFQFDPVSSDFKTLNFDRTNGANPSDLQLLPVSSRVAQSISFSPLDDKVVGQPPFILNATASSGLPVSFSTDSPVRLDVTGVSATLLSSGRARVRASQGGSVAFLPAADVIQEFCINPVKPSIEVIDSNPLTPTISSDAVSGNQWYQDGVALPGENNKTLTITSSGNYSVEVQVDGCVSERSDNFPVVITDIEDDPGFLVVTPNPVSNRFSILLPKSGDYEVSIFSSEGRVISQFNTSLCEVEMKSVDLSAGLYFVKAIGNAEILITKFLKL